MRPWIIPAIALALFGCEAGELSQETTKTAASNLLCRRMSIDLAGRIPTESELDACAEQTRAETADMFMALPEYARTQRRNWGELLEYDVALAWYGHVIDMDAIVARHFKRETRYSEMARALVAHPGFYARHQGDDWAAAIFHVFLGRNARPDELAGMRPLSYVFDSRLACDGATQYNILLDDPELSASFCDTPAEEVGLAFCNCEAGEGYVGCRSTVLGEEIDLGYEECGEEDSHLVRITDGGLGMRTTCPDGQDGCHDLAVSEEDEATITGDAPALPKASNDQLDKMDNIGRVLSRRPDFWEAAVDRELRYFLGWWQSSFRRPDTDQPELRAALAKLLAEEDSLPALQRAIVTSALYAGEEGDEDASKLLTAESWLDSAALAVGEQLGACDFRLVSGEDDGRILVDPNLFESVPATIEGYDPETYDETAVKLGGCSPDHARPRISGLGMLYSEASLATELCSVGSRVLPERFDREDESDRALREAIIPFLTRALSTPPTETELDTYVDEMRACLAAGADDGCAGAEEAVRWLCARVIDSAAFSID